MPPCERTASTSLVRQNAAGPAGRTALTGSAGRTSDRNPFLGRTLVSDTTELLTGPADAPDGTPTGASSSGETPPQVSGAPARQRRRAGTGLASMLLPELQRLAQSLGISGTGRMRKSQLVAAIQERAILDEPADDGRDLDQGSSAMAPAAAGAASALPGYPAGATDQDSAKRGAPAGAGAPRPDEQDAMQSDMSADPGANTGATDEQLSFDRARIGGAGTGSDAPATSAYPGFARSGDVAWGAGQAGAPVPGNAVPGNAGPESPGPAA